MNTKVKKIALYTFALIVLHIIISFIFIYICYICDLHEDLTDKEKFFKWFNSNYLILFFFYIYFVVREIRKK